MDRLEMVLLTLDERLAGAPGAAAVIDVVC